MPAIHLVTMWPLAVYFAVVILLVAGMLSLSYLLGQRHRARATGEPYESGVVSTGSARLRFSAQFYLVAMLFVIFDLEAVFIFAWAVAFREVISPRSRISRPRRRGAGSIETDRLPPPAGCM